MDLALRVGRAGFVPLPGSRQSLLLPISEPVEFFGVPQLIGSLGGAQYGRSRIVAGHDLGHASLRIHHDQDAAGWSDETVVQARGPGAGVVTVGRAGVDGELEAAGLLGETLYWLLTINTGRYAEFAPGMVALALIGLFNIIGSFAAGWAGGRFSKKYLLSSIYAARALLIGLVLAFPLTPAVLYVFAIGMGLLWLGTVPLTNGLVGQIFGTRYMATLTSIVFFGHQVGSFIGVWLAGYLYDTTGSYDGALAVAIGLGLFAAAVNLPVNERPLAERRAAAAA